MVLSEISFIIRVLFTYLKELFHEVKVAPEAFESFARDFIRLEKFLDEAHRKEADALGILHLQGEVDDLRGQLSKLAKTLTEVEWKQGALRDYFYNFRNRKRLSEEMKLLNLRLLELKQSIGTFGLKHCLETNVAKVDDERMKQILEKTVSRDILLSYLRNAIESTCCWELCGPCRLWSARPVPTRPSRRPAPGTSNPSRATSGNNQPNANPTATSQKSPSQSSGSSQTPKALSRASTSTKTSSKPTSSESPNVTPQSAIKTKSPAPTSTSPSQPVAEIQRPSSTAPQPIRPATQTSPLRSPEQLVGRTSPLQDQAPQKQPPSSPAPANLQSRTSSQTSTQSRTGTQRRATSESPPPSNASPQSKPHSRTSIESKNTSQSPLTSHPKSTVSETDSQPSSPARSQHKNSSSAVYQPRSPPSPGNNLSEKITKNIQPTAGVPTQTGSPSKIINPREGSLPSPTSINPSSPMSKNQNQALSQSQLQAQPEKDITDKVISKAPIEATIKPIAVTPSQQSDPPSTIPTLMAAEEMTEKYKEVMHSNPPMLYGKQSKSTASHQSNKNRAGASRQKPMASNGEGISMQKEIKNDISKLTQKMANEQQGKPVSVITLVGENKGATMQLGSQKEGAVHIHRGYKHNPNESTKATTNGEESSKDKRPKEANNKEDQMTKAYMNSNTQGINNSVVFKSSITERNPGIHLTLTQNPTDPIKTTTNENQLVAQKAEANIMPSQKLTYETTIRRRCLRGLLMESSDSDPDNPEKPRRHGCRCSFGDLNKDKEIHLL